MRWFLLLLAVGVSACTGGSSILERPASERIEQLERELEALHAAIESAEFSAQLQQVGPPGWLTDHRGRRFRLWHGTRNIIEIEGFLAEYPLGGYVAAPSKAVTEVLQGPSATYRKLFYAESDCNSMPMVCAALGPAADFVVDRQGSGTTISDYTIYRILKSVRPVSAVIRSARDFDPDRCTNLDSPEMLSTCSPIELVDDDALKQRLMLAYPVTVTFESYPF